MAVSTVETPVMDTTGTDPIKLFVGQIPNSWEEAQLRKILEPFGPVNDLIILTDRVTGVHKGSVGNSFTVYS